MAIHIAYANAEAIVGVLAVFQLHRGEHLPVAFAFENSLSDHALVPEREIVSRHGEFAGGKHPAASFLGGDAEWPESMAIVSGGIGLRELGFVGVPHRLHTERMKDMLTEKIHQLLATHFFDDRAGDDEIRI